MDQKWVRLRYVCVYVCICKGGEMEETSNTHVDYDDSEYIFIAQESCFRITMTWLMAGLNEHVYETLRDERCRSEFVEWLIAFTLFHSNAWSLSSGSLKHVSLLRDSDVLTRL